MKKKSVSISDMRKNRLYVDMSGVLHRRIDGKLERRNKAGEWEEIKLTQEILISMRLREY